MANVGEIVSLVVDGHALQGWQRVSVTRSAEAAAISFSLNATNPAWSAEARALRKGKLVEIYTTPDTGQGLGAFTGGDLLCRGYVDEYEVEIGENGHREVGLSGRSKAGDAIDCPPAKHKTGLVENKDLKAAATEFDEWDIGFTADVALKKIPMVQLVPGQSMFRVLEREARRVGVLLSGQPDGSVKITRAGSTRHGGGLIEGFAPLRKIKLRFSIQNKRSEVIVRGQTSTGTGKTALRQEERVKDKTVGRHRPEILFNEGSDTAKELKRRGKWQQLRRSGSGIAASVTVSTWRDAAGKLWSPPDLVPLSVPSEDLDMDFALSTVTFQQGVGEGEGAGTLADLTLVDPRTLGGKGGGSGSESTGSGGSSDGGSNAGNGDFDAGSDLGDGASFEGGSDDLGSDGLE